jgi:methyl-accepting chemotaxis protein
MTDKTIAQKSRKGAISILLVLLLGGLLAGYGFNDVRMGGPLHHRNQQVSDFIADIIPPPEYVLEAYLEVSLLHNKPALLSEKRLRLGELERSFRQRARDWASSDLDADLKAQLATQAVPSGDHSGPLSMTPICPPLPVAIRPGPKPPMTN